MKHIFKLILISFITWLMYYASNEIDIEFISYLVFYSFIIYLL